MRTMARGNVVACLAGAVIAGAAAFSLASSASAAPVIGNAAQSGANSSVELAQYGSAYCARLRRACMYKHERGEVGEGNCRRYRSECTRGYRSDRDWYR